MVFIKSFVMYISAFDYYECIYWFHAYTFENKMLQYFTETSESHVGYFQVWRHILRHLRHLLALCWKSHKPPFRLSQLIYLMGISTIRTCRVILLLKITEKKEADNITLRKCKIWSKPCVSEQRCVNTRLEVTFRFCRLHLHQMHRGVPDRDLSWVT